MRRNHYRPCDDQEAANGGWALASFTTPVLCGRRNWGAATPRLEEVDCKACLRLIDAARKKLAREQEEWREAERQTAEIFQRADYVARIFRQRTGRA